MACLTLTYVTAVMIGVNIMCAIVLGVILKAIGGKQFKTFSHVNNATGREVFKLTTVGSAVFFLVQTLVFATILGMELGIENFA